ncbi:HEAT repeat domain-containing protein [Armatimonas sp.]|uniref:HEAT repeat domain-containing protein n=1 Tax=Armatimonas sp. TaxID=1872638 RepID=UPI0037511485
MKALSPDTRRRIAWHLVNLASDDNATATQAELRLLRFGKKAIRQLLELVASENPCVRFRVVYLLGKTGEQELFPMVASFIHDPDAHVRYDAVMSLGYLGDPRAIPLLEELATQSDDPACVASAACMSLVQFGIDRSPDENHTDV